MLGRGECQTGGHPAVSLASRLFQSQDRRSPARSGIQSVSVLESRASQNLRAGESASPAHTKPTDRRPGGRKPAHGSGSVPRPPRAVVLRSFQRNENSLQYTVMQRLSSAKLSLGFIRRCAIGQQMVTRSAWLGQDRKSTRLNSSHLGISYAVFCLKKKKKTRSISIDDYKINV